MPGSQDRTWVRLWRENAPELRERVVAWRRQPAICRIERPARLRGSGDEDARKGVLVE